LGQSASPKRLPCKLTERPRIYSRWTSPQRTRRTENLTGRPQRPQRLNFQRMGTRARDIGCAAPWIFPSVDSVSRSPLWPLRLFLLKFSVLCVLRVLGRRSDRGRWGEVCSVVKCRSVSARWLLRFPQFDWITLGVMQASKPAIRVTLRINFYLDSCRL
jgi:hypothetical protein